MNENNEIYEENTFDSVSDNQILDNPDGYTDALPDISENPVLDTDVEIDADSSAEFSDSDTDTVSGSDVRTFFEDYMSSVSSGDVYNITYETQTEEEPPIWEKSISDYTVTEGLLLLIFILLSMLAISSIFRRS